MLKSALTVQCNIETHNELPRFTSLPSRLLLVDGSEQQLSRTAFFTLACLRWPIPVAMVVQLSQWKVCGTAHARSARPCLGYRWDRWRPLSRRWQALSVCGGFECYK